VHLLKISWETTACEGTEGMVR